MPQYRLTYFDARGYGETARMLFALAGQEFEDRRMTSDEWKDIKPTTPFGQVPMLEVDGVKISQSYAIYRYLARAFDLAGGDGSLLSEAKVDMIVECLRDVQQAIFKVMSEKDAEKKDEKLKVLREETLPSQFKKIEAFIGDQEFFLGSSITWVDLVFFNTAPLFRNIGIPSELDNYPKLKAVNDSVANNPRIAEWVKNRKETEY